ncbi:hypothetical protein Bpfe_000952 [Biomphalaria pfeifferi]|uniref:CABIT domain-containing protein n=1 Tax=Biomphalaria pfeifferi TaxID=112525 RepID=A0AAD8CB82_BIOPF|nr:hypothetical protein Bpfe_000952 [Biomphalaria pfeifferi]
MGLSKKLGVWSQKTFQGGSQEVVYKWSNQAYTLGEVIRNFKLPCVVQCDTDPCCVLWSDFQFDLCQPLLLYSTRSTQKVHAISVHEEPSKQILEELDPPLAIPRDFEGWFAARPKGVDKLKVHKTIEDVVNSTAIRFLVTSKCSAFTTIKSVGGSFQYKEREITPGEIFRKVCVMRNEPVNDALAELIKDYGPCLACLDEKDDDILIPLANETLCYDLAEMYPEMGDQIFRISSLIDGGNSKLPRLLQLIYGDPPVLNYSFTGMLRCYSIFTEETILAAILNPDKSMCLELTTDSVTKFRLALNESAIKKTIEYTNTFHLCDSFGSKFLTAIKVSFSLKPSLSDSQELTIASGDSDTQDTNDSDTNGSDTQDINADSEFDVEWRSVPGDMVLQSKHSSYKINNATISEQTNFEHLNESVPNLMKDKLYDGSMHPNNSQTNRVNWNNKMTKSQLNRKSVEDEIVDKISSIEIHHTRDEDFTSSRNIFSIINSNLSSSMSIEADVHKPKSGDKNTVDKENPLLYLFHPIKNKDETSLGTKEDVHAVSIDLENVSDSTFDPRVPCKPAKEYVESEETGESSDSEFMESSEPRQEPGQFSFAPYERCEGSLQSEKNTCSVKSPDYQNIQFDEKKYDSYNKKGIFSLTPTLDIQQTYSDKHEPMISEENDSSEDEYDAEDILSLAASESEKLSTLSKNEHQFSGTFPLEKSDKVAEIQEYRGIHERFALLGRQVSCESSASQESFARFNSLIEEVTALVNTSSSRIIGASNRKPKTRNKLLQVQRSKYDKGYTELVSSTETIPESLPGALSGASSKSQETSKAASKPLFPETEHFVSKPSSLPLLNQAALSNKFTTNSLDDITALNSANKHSEELHLIPKVNVHENSFRPFGVLKRSRGQQNIIEALDSKYLSAIDQSQNKEMPPNVLSVMKDTSDHPPVLQRSNPSGNQTIQDHLEENVTDPKIYSNISLMRQKSETVEITSSRTSVDSDLTSVSSMNSVLYHPNQSHISSTELAADKSNFWI